METGKFGGFKVLEDLTKVKLNPDLIPSLKEVKQMRKFKATTIVSNLKSRFPDIEGIRETDPLFADFNRAGDRVHLGNAAEGGEIDGLPAADYYGEFRGGYPWINEKLEKAVKGMGYHIEWYDPGTLIAYRD